MFKSIVKVAGQALTLGALLVVGLYPILGAPGLATADQGDLLAMRIAAGNALQTRAIALSNSAATEIATSSMTRVDLTCVNTANGYTIYIGTNAASATLATMGLPIFSSGTFTLGAHTGSVYAILESGGSGSIRCAAGLTQ